MDPLALIEDYLSDQENGMKNLITGFLNQVMLAEALQQAGAAQYERTDARKAHRNGYKDRSLKTRYGETILRKPQFRELPFETQVFGRYARVEKALVNAIVESYLQGVSTRKIQHISQNIFYFAYALPLSAFLLCRRSGAKATLIKAGIFIKEMIRG